MRRPTPTSTFVAIGVFVGVFAAVVLSGVDIDEAALALLACGERKRERCNETVNAAGATEI